MGEEERGRVAVQDSSVALWLRQPRREANNWMLTRVHGYSTVEMEIAEMPTRGIRDVALALAKVE